MEALSLEALEPKIRAIARRYVSSPNDIDDMEQIGRIAAWKVLEKNSGANIAYVSKSIENAFLKNYRDSRRKKRMPASGFVSLHDEDENGLTMEDKLCSHDPLLTVRERVDQLREKLGMDKGHKQRLAYLSRKDVRELITFVVEEIVRVPRDEIVTTVTLDFFKERGLAEIPWIFYKNRIHYLLADVYPEEYWEQGKTVKGFWAGVDGREHRCIALRRFARKKNVTSANDCKRITHQDFKDEGLETVLEYYYHASPYLAMKEIFPGLHAWQAHVLPKGYLDSIENRKEMLTAYVMDNDCSPLTGLTPEETYEQGLRRFVSFPSMKSFGLHGLVKRHGNSPYRTFQALFPEQILPWTLANSKEVWAVNPHETAAAATRWLFEKYLVILQEDIPRYATNNFFKHMGFGGMLTSSSLGFNSSPFALVDNAYPGAYVERDFRRRRDVCYLDMRDMRRKNQ